MKHKFDIGDKVFFPSFDFNGFFQKIESGIIHSVTKEEKKDGPTFLYVVDTHLCTSKNEDTLCATIEEAEKLAVEMVLRDAKRRYSLVRELSEKYNMLEKEKK